MPIKITTETDLIRLLSNSPLQIELDFIKLKSHTSKNTPIEHLQMFYKDFDSIKNTKYDGMIMPVSTGIAPKLEKPTTNGDSPILEEILQIANHGGYPSITIPNGFIDGMSVGVNITCKVKDDVNALNIAYALESKMEYKNQIAGGEK